jgi:uracil-DNA glycosylase
LEIELLERLRVLVALGSFAWEGALLALASNGHPTPKPKPGFGHGREAGIGAYRLLGCFHPSQQNTFTGKLTPGMLDAVLGRAIDLAS